MKISDRLAIYGWKKETEDFFFEVARLWWRDYEPKHTTVEQFLFHPTECMEFCAIIRHRTSIRMPEDEILRCLSNLRKDKYLERVKDYATGNVSLREE